MTSDSSALISSAKHRSDPPLMDTSYSRAVISSHKSVEAFATASQSVGALQKAKKTLKTFIGKSSDKSSKSQMKGPTMSVESMSSQQRLAPVIAGNAFSLMNGHSIRAQSQFKSGELCAVCENFMCGPSEQRAREKNFETNAGYKCCECQLLFHSKCVHSCHQIPCRSLTNAHNTASALTLRPIDQNRGELLLWFHKVTDALILRSQPIPSPSIQTPQEQTV